MPTRIDEDLQEYCLALQEKETIGDEEIRRLLDAYRLKFGVDLVYIGEVTADQKGIWFPHVSALGERSRLQGTHRAFSADVSEILTGRYDDEGLCSYPPDLEGAGCAVSVLRYGVLQEGQLVGDIGVADLCKERTWTKEERAAVQKLGRILRPVLCMERSVRVRAWEKERQAEQIRALEALFATTDCGMIRHSQDGTHVFSVNPTALRLLGYDSEEDLVADGFALVAMSVLDEDKPKVRAKIKSLKKAGDSADIEYRVRQKDGSVRDIIGKIQLLEENGELVYQRFLFDHTAKKAVEVRKKLQEQSRQTEMIRALCMEYGEVYLVDLDTGMAVSCRLDKDLSDGESVFGQEFPFAEKIERYVEEHVYGPDQALLRDAVSVEQLTKALSQRGATHTNFRAVSSGQIEYVQMKAVRSENWDSAHCIVVGFCSVDEEIRHEIDQKRLVEDALAQAQRANMVKATFLANMSHDIRTPMNAILGFTTLATIHIDQKERLQEYLGKIMASGNHLLGLINDILDMSHLERGDVSLDERACSLPEILHELPNILQAGITAKKQRLLIDTASVVDEEIYCDSLWLNQVFLNLLDNAIKFTGEGGTISLTVTEKPCLAAGWADYSFHVKDDGIGMSPAFLEHIFEPFEREHSSTISGVQGTGLGMTITKSVVEMMGGTIRMESEEGKGTEAIVSIAFRLASPAESARDGLERAGERKSGSAGERTSVGTDGTMSSADRAAAGTESGGSVAGIERGRADETESGGADRPGRQEQADRQTSMRILLTEDNELNQEIAMEILQEAGYQVDVADNGQIAVDMLREAGPGYYRMVLMDLQMPVMDGYEASRNIRKLEDPRIASIPILAVSANTFEEDVRMAIESGMNGHFPKPIDADKLLQTMEELLATYDRAPDGRS